LPGIDGGPPLKRITDVSSPASASTLTMNDIVEMVIALLMPTWVKGERVKPCRYHHHSSCDFPPVEPVCTWTVWEKKGGGKASVVELCTFDF
jgi:hypothetical protein